MGAGEKKPPPPPVSLLPSTGDKGATTPRQGQICLSRCCGTSCL
nr:MAG TPA: hypothetical protein [Bacteriophage sp.]